MGVFSKMKEIMTGGRNQEEDLEKVFEQYLKKLEDDLTRVKTETATRLAEEKNAQRRLAECEQECDRISNFARMAREAGNDDEAVQFEQKIQQLSIKKQQCLEQYTAACGYAVQLKEHHDQLTQELLDLRARKAMLLEKLKDAKMQEKRNERAGSDNSRTSSVEDIDKMEERINQRLDDAYAVSEGRTYADRPVNEEEIEALRSALGL